MTEAKLEVNDSIMFIRCGHVSKPTRRVSIDTSADPKPTSAWLLHRTVFADGLAAHYVKSRAFQHLVNSRLPEKIHRAAANIMQPDLSHGHAPRPKPRP